MTKFKKVVAMVLAFLMIFSSASVVASAWTVSDDGNTLEISTKFFEVADDGTEVEITKVAPGTTVKARVYLGTDYYSNDGTLLFFYDKDFFTHSYGTSKNALEINAAAGLNGGSLYADPNLADQVSNGYIDDAFLSEYGAFAVNYDASADDKNVMFDAGTWLFEFTLTVSEDATGEGDLFVKDTTVQNTTRTNALISVPKGPADGTSVDAWDMWLWDANVVLSSQPISTLSSVTFNANGGTYADGSDTYVYGGEDIDIGEPVVAPDAPAREGYTFMGWIDAADDTPTLEEAGAAPATVPENDLVLNAYWLKNVTITFDTDGGSDIAPIENVTPYTDFADIEDPTKDGYTFVGWDVRDGELPAEYPDVDTTYTAIWALNVTVSFDTNGAAEIPSIDGYEGAPFTAVIDDPSKEGHRFTGWTPELPTVFPEADTTYTATFEAEAYPVYYYVDGKLAGVSIVEYGLDIPTEISYITAPAGKELVKWFTDKEFANAFAGGTMGKGEVSLYAYTKNASYKAYFIVDGEVYDEVTTEFEKDIAVPAIAPTKAGYDFEGWTPYVGSHDEPNDMYFYASWAYAERTVEYYYDDGTTLYETYDLATGDEFDVPADAYKEGYTFKYWTDTVGSTTEVQLPETMPELADGEVLKYYAVFEINTYTVTWDVDGEPSTETYEYGAEITKKDAPAKEGYTFAGWDGYTDGMTMPAQDITLTATWTVNQYNALFYADGVLVATVPTNYGEVPVAPTDPSKAGYAFDGWTPELAAMGIDGARYDAVFVAGAVNYTVETYIMDVTGAYGDPTSETKAGTADTTATVAHETKEGFSADLANSVLSGNINGDGSLVLKVYYSRNQYTFTTNVDGATTPTTYYYEAAVAEPADPAKEGHTFAGWTPAVPATMPAENVEVTATWTVNEYDVTWDVDGETTTNTHAYGTEITVPSDPAKEGHTFAGWTPAVETTMGAADVTYTATWTVNQYNAEFYADGNLIATVPTEYGKVPVAPTAPDKTGYGFNGWTPELTAMGVDGARYDAVYVAGAVEYTVETYTMDTTGAYGAPTSETKSGTADTTATVAHETKEGFSADLTSSVLSGNIAADGSLVLKVYYSRNQYTFTTNVDGATTPTTYYYEAAVAEPTDPEKAGYDFAGWSPAVPATMPAGDVTVTATWTEATDTAYQVVINYNDGANNDAAATHATSYEGTTGNAIVIVDEVPATPAEKTEYVLWSDVIEGWDDAVYYELDADAANSDYTNGTVTVAADGSTVLNLYYVPVMYTATFDANSGAWADGSTTATVTLDHFTYVAENVPATEPTREGYTFAGWLGLTDTTTLNNNTRVFRANWTANTYVVTWADYDMTVPTTYGANINMQVVPTKEGHTFAGWAWTKTADGTAVSETTTMPAYDLTITATWTVNNYTVTWDVDGVTSTETYAYGAEIAEKAAPSKEGHTFAGWEGYTDGMTMGATDTTFKATWTVNEYSVTWDVDGETTTNKHAYGTEITVPSDPAKEGHTFAGWSPAVETTMGAADVTYTATWTVNNYTVTWDVDGVTSTETYAYGAEIAEKAAPSKEGHTFAGWEGYTDGMTMGAADTTFKATWTVNQYNAEFYADGNLIATVPTNYGEVPVAPTAPSKEGYGFNGWTPELAAMGVDGARYDAVYVAGAVEYTVETYIMDTTGAYGAPTSETKSGTADTTATVAHEAKEGFTADLASSVLSGNINADGSLVLKLYYSRNQYTFTTNVDGVTTPVTYYYEATVATPTTPTKEGYTFAAWNPAVPATMPAENVEVTATWTTNEYTVTWDVDGETTTNTHAYGTEITVPADPAKEGHTFAGWEGYTDGMTMPAADTTFKATWTTNNYTVTWIVDGEETVDTVAYGAAITAPTAPTKEGHTFAGWEGYTDGMTMPAEDLEFTAQWSINSYKVTFYTDDTKSATVYDATLTYGQEYNVPTATKEGHTFAGWADASTGAVVELAAIEKVPASDVAYYATWTVNEYVLTYRTYNGIYIQENVAYGTALTAPEAPTREGYTFTGWNATIPETMPAENVTLVAQWSINSYTITWVDGDSTSTETLAYGADVTVPAPTKEGHTFGGWTWTKTEDGSAAEEAATMPAYNLTATASWTVNEYDVTWDVDGETTTNTHAYGTEITVPSDPAKEGHTFAGWTPAVETTMGAADVTYTATWTVNEYDVTWDVDGETTTNTHAYGTEITVPADPTKEGYTFAGWTPAVETTMGAADVTYTATWTVNQYNAEFYADGNLIATVPTNYGEVPVAPTAPSKEGYGFNGWTPELAAMGVDGARYDAVYVAGAVEYTVETYIMDTTGAYGAPTSETKSGTADTTATVAHEAKEGFTADLASSVLSGNIAADGSLVLKVYYSRNQYTFTTNVDGVTTPVTYYYEATVATPTTPTKEGYTFAAWNPAVPATMPAENVEVTASWTVNEYDVTWDVDGETTTNTHAYGTEITVPADPAKEGHTFAGWTPAVETTMGAADVTYTATWTVNEYDVTWDVDGETTTNTHAYGTEITVPADPTKEGHTFAGWTPAVETTMGAADVTYTATWTVNQYTVTYANTGDTAIEAVKADYGTVITVPAAPTWAGYTFRGWFDADNNAYAAGSTFTLTKDITITATWTANNYTVTWVVDSVETAIDNYDFGETIKVPETPTKEGYTFAGWAWTNEAGESVATSATMPAYNVIATATWTANDGIGYTVNIYKMATDGATYALADTKELTDKAGEEVTYAPENLTGFTYNAGKSTVTGTVAGDGSLVLSVYYDRNQYTFSTTVDGVTESAVYYYEAAITAPATPAKEGNTFAGWVDAEGNAATVPATMGAGNVALTATWTVNNYTVTWIIDGNETVETYAYGAAVTAPTVPAKDGYRFHGWSAAVPATMPAENLTFTAIYETSTYVVYYYVDGVLVDAISAEYGDTIVAEDMTAPTGYTWDGWYTNEEMTAEFTGGTVSNANTALYSKNVANEYDAIFMVDGEVYETVKATFDEKIEAPEAPTKEGYTFNGWTPYVGIMDEEGKTFEATWIETAEQYVLTYIVDGEPYETYKLALNDELDVPADPYKEGWEFVGWATAPDATETVTLPSTMPANDLTYYAVFSQSTYTVTWIIDGVEDVDTYAYGAAITAPEAAKEGFEFKGWSLTEDGEIVTPATTMPAENLTYYAVFEETVAKLPIKLVPVEGYTGVVERNIDGVQYIESYNDGYTVTEDGYENAEANFDEYYVYGFTGRRFRESDVEDYFTVQGDGYMDLEYSELTGVYGTGAKIIVKENGTDAVVEEFYVIIFGDIDGDARVNATDSSSLVTELSSTTPTWSNRRNPVPYRIKAADLDLNGRINANDSAALKNNLSGTATIDQITGLAS